MPRDNLAAYRGDANAVASPLHSSQLESVDHNAFRCPRKNMNLSLKSNAPAWKPRKYLILAAIYVFLVLMVIVQSKSGRLATPLLGVDWAHSMTLIETLYSDGTRDLNDAAGNLQEMSKYPDMSHWAVVYLAKVLEISPLFAIQIMVGVLCITGAFLVALKLELWAQMSPSLISRALVLVWLGITVAVGLNLQGQIKYNFFFAQLFGTVIAIAANLIVTRVRMPEPLLLSTIICFAGIVLPNAHLVPTVWFLLSSMIYLCGKHETWSRRAILAAAVLAPVGLSWFVNPSVMQMIRIGGAGGDFWLSTVLVRSSIYIALVCLLSAGVLIFVLMRSRRADASKQWSEMISSQAGFVAVVFLLITQILVVMVGRGEVYSVAKYLYIFCLEFPSVIYLAASVLGPKSKQQLTTRWQSALSWAAMGLFFLFQLPYPAFTYDQTALVEITDSLRENSKVKKLQERGYPQFEGLSSAMNYYLAIGILRLPRDARTMHWFVEAHGVGETPLTADWLALAPVSYEYQLSTAADAVRGALAAGSSYESTYESRTQQNSDSQNNFQPRGTRLLSAFGGLTITVGPSRRVAPFYRAKMTNGNDSFPRFRTSNPARTWPLFA